jgi:predicted exporter
MLELLSMLGGGVFRLLPEVIKFFTAKRDAEHEYRMTQLQLEIDKARAEQQIDLVHAQGAIAADTAEMSAMVEALKAQSTPSGVPWIDGLSSSVRPVLTYWWCLVLYTAYKVISVMVATAAGAGLPEISALLVTEFDRMVIGSIFAFWFVDRSLRKGKG